MNIIIIHTKTIKKSRKIYYLKHLEALYPFCVRLSLWWFSVVILKPLFNVVINSSKCCQSTIFLALCDNIQYKKHVLFDNNAEITCIPWQYPMDSLYAENAVKTLYKDFWDSVAVSSSLLTFLYNECLSKLFAYIYCLIYFSIIPAIMLYYHWLSTMCSK